MAPYPHATPIMRTKYEILNIPPSGPLING